ncbi:hypothetical protein H4219_002940 [Mycoemilia scoparia]|uniref:BLOC-1-related complex subunit 5 n=1 Tax=Mycoemilia scoparia TaxID=417184 RepID=A0A9W8DPY2_9FUNG|nr:hypothetical protein H4219_002940 [Mycoemilia scoparia]
MGNTHSSAKSGAAAAGRGGDGNGNIYSRSRSGSVRSTRRLSSLWYQQPAGRSSVLSFKSTDGHYGRPSFPLTTNHKQSIQNEFNTITNAASAGGGGGSQKVLRRNPAFGASSRSISCISEETLEPQQESSSASFTSETCSSHRQQRHRSRTAASERGVVMVTSVSKMPLLDPELYTLNSIAPLNPIVNQSVKRVFNFIKPSNCVDLSPEEMNIDCGDMADLALTTNTYIQDRVDRALSAQEDLTAKAKTLERRSIQFYSKMMLSNKRAKEQLENMSVVSSLQRQAEKSYELMQSIFQDMERLESLLPVKDRISANEPEFERKYPNIKAVFASRRRQLMLSRTCSENGSRTPNNLGHTILTPQGTPRGSDGGALISHQATRSLSYQPALSPPRLYSIRLEGATAPDGSPLLRRSSHGMAYPRSENRSDGPSTGSPSLKERGVPVSRFSSRRRPMSVVSLNLDSAVSNSTDYLPLDGIWRDGAASSGSMSSPSLANLARHSSNPGTASEQQQHHHQWIPSHSREVSRSKHTHTSSQCSGTSSSSISRPMLSPRFNPGSPMKQASFQLDSSDKDSIGGDSVRLPENASIDSKESQLIKARTLTQTSDAMSTTSNNSFIRDDNSSSSKLYIAAVPTTLTPKKDISSALPDMSSTPSSPGSPPIYYPERQRSRTMAASPRQGPISESARILLQVQLENQEITKSRRRGGSLSKNTRFSQARYSSNPAYVIGLSSMSTVPNSGNPDGAHTFERPRARLSSNPIASMSATSLSTMGASSYNISSSGQQKEPEDSSNSITYGLGSRGSSQYMPPPSSESGLFNSEKLNNKNTEPSDMSGASYEKDISKQQSLIIRTQKQQQHRIWQANRNYAQVPSHRRTMYDLVEYTSGLSLGGCDRQNIGHRQARVSSLGPSIMSGPSTTTIVKHPPKPRRTVSDMYSTTPKANTLSASMTTESHVSAANATTTTALESSTKNITLPQTKVTNVNNNTSILSPSQQSKPASISSSSSPSSPSLAILTSPPTSSQVQAIMKPSPSSSVAAYSSCSKLMTSNPIARAATTTPAATAAATATHVLSSK